MKTKDAPSQVRSRNGVSGFLGFEGLPLTTQIICFFWSGARVFRGGETVKVKQIPSNLFGDTGKKKQKRVRSGLSL